jgi:hypothetical protein
MNLPNCIKCGHPDTKFSFSFCHDNIEFYRDSKTVIIYFYCTNCKTEFQGEYDLDELSIVSEES